MNKLAFTLGFMDKISKMKALPHQERVLEKIKDEKSKGLLLYHSLGSGKTFSAINTAKELGLPLLAIVPAALRSNFEKEIVKAGFKGEHKVMSYEKATKLVDDLDFLRYAAKSLVVYDEAHRMGRSESMRSRLARKIPAKKVVMLTGTPLRNRPEEIVPLMRAFDIEDFPKDSVSFKKRYIGKKKIDPGIYARWVKGIKPSSVDVAVNLSDFAEKTTKVTDYHNSFDKKYFPDVEKEVVKVPMSQNQLATYSFMVGKYPKLAYKMTHGIPPSKSEMGEMMSFMVGPRMVSNNPQSFSETAKPEDATKIVYATNEIKKQMDSDKNFKGVVYSNFIENGLSPMMASLDKLKIKYTKFTGSMNDKLKKEAIDEYNSGKTKLLLISGAGAEGIDLKGTKLIQILEPHWNEEKLNQVQGRAIRFQSHSHLPENERIVKVQKYQSTVPKSFFQGALGWKADFSSDEYLDMLSKKKTALNSQFLKAMRATSEDIRDYKKKERKEKVVSYVKEIANTAKKIIGPIVKFGIDILPSILR